ncbi:hypothetical protein DFH06DRAFT_1125507 [Mycena polygramma]|nr:hypothetical protein DFH06DRAFT_1125507 [Mycena polygramma]
MIQAKAFPVPSFLTGCTPAELNRSLLQSVTHLELFSGDTQIQSAWQHWCDLASLPALTHLGLSPPIARGILPEVLAECPRLLILVVTSYYSRQDAVEFSQNLAVTDPRVAVVDVGATWELDWENGARGGADFWVRVERFLARKQAGEIAKDCYFLDETAGVSTAYLIRR